jgi:predicted transposase/invertase (TIGR01784 family)
MYTDNDFIRLDWATKYVLRDKADFEVFEGLMTVLFGEHVKIIELLESESNRENKDAKSNQVDIKAKNSKDEIILVEIQLEHQADFLERILFGVSKTITEHIGRGQDYSKVKKVYSINILYFNLGVGKDYIYHGTNSFTGLNTGDTLVFNKREKQGYSSKKRANIFPEYYILRVNQYEKETPETPLEEWMQYLKDGYILPNTTTPGLQKARECLRVLSMTDKDRKAYERYLYNKVYEEDVVETAREDGWFEGYDEGEVKGRNEAILEIVQKMQAEGVNPETIFRLTGYSE